MDIETQGLGAGSYPEKPEPKEKNIEVVVYVKYTLEIDVPEKWNKQEIEQYVKEEFQDFKKYDEEILEIEL